MYAVLPLRGPLPQNGSCHAKWRNIFMNTRENRSPRRKDANQQRKPAGNVAGWRQSFERYMALAQNVGQHEDDVTREGYYQHAEHYLRMMNEAAAAAGER